MKHTKLTKQELNAVKEAAETVASQYDAISKIDFCIAVKNLVTDGKNNIRTAVDVWNKNYAD